MLIRHLSDRASRDLELAITRPDAVAHDLAVALDPTPAGRCGPQPLWVDGRRVAPDAPLGGAGITNGSTVSRHAVPVPGGSASSPLVTVTTPARGNPAHVGTTPRNRTGRPAPPPVPPAVVLPDAEPTVPAVTPIGVVAMAVSVLGAGVMVAVLGSWTYAAFAVVGPLMMLANTLDSRYRRRRVRRRYARLVRREVVRLDAELRAAGDAERVRRGAAFPGVTTAIALATADPPACWERRPGDPDAWSVRVGFGDGTWEPPVEGDLATAAEEVRAVVDTHRRLPAVALGLAIRPGAPVAVIGPGRAARALARSILLQLSSLHGPVDLGISAVVAAETAPAWDWLAWLPQVIGRDGRRSLAVSGPEADALAARLTRSCDRASTATTTGPVQLVVIDDPAALRARRSAARALLRLAADPTSACACLVVLGPDDPVPAACTIVLRVGSDGALVTAAPISGGPAVASVASLRTATEVARHLARFDDPDVDRDGRMLPDEVRLTAVLDLDDPDPTGAGVVERWADAGADPPVLALLGMAADGPLGVDLVADGPHVLVAGTTGSGKSEALRSLVVSLAASNSPDHLVFVLVDFKGGSAFDACARLPHTVGLVTDLDDHLAARALRCLEAELRHREERLRAVGAADITAFRRLDRAGEPLPRLVVVIDEFAALATALPTFVDSLVDVAQRGRSLGVHLVLATQRPGGAVSPAIRANVGVRIALRVQSADESNDVLDSPLAADLPRHVAGRAIVRLGPGDLVPVQVACASLPRLDGLPPVTLRPLGIPRPTTTATTTGVGESPDPGGTDLDRLVTELTTAWRTLDRPEPRRPWPDPLPERLSWPIPLDGQPPAASLVLGLMDDPDRQRVVPYRWDLDGGPLLGVGLPGAGARSLATTVVLAASARWGVDTNHVHVLDGAGSDLVPLAGLPQVGAVVTGAQIERQRRLVDSLGAELAARRAGSATTIRRLLVVHGVTALHARWDDVGLLDCWHQLLALVADGSGHGIHVCCTAESASVPHRLVAACEQRLVFRLGDPTDHAAFGIAPREVPALPAGRAMAPQGHGAAALVQVAYPASGLAAAVARLSGRPALAASAGHHPPPWVGVLPDHVTPVELAEAGRPGRRAIPTVAPARPGGSGGLRLAIGLADKGLQVATVELAPGGHAVVSGPPRSGRTTALAALARAAASVDGLRVVVVLAGPRAATGDRRLGSSPWPETVEVVGADSGVVAALLDHDEATLVLVDDADRTPDDHPTLRALAVERRPQRHVVAAGRNDRLRSRYGHWTREVRADGTGLLLVPDLDLDGDLLGVRLPRRPPVTLVPGRAWSAGTGVGADGFVQVAHDPPPSRP